MEITRQQFEGAGINCPMEILVIAAVLGGLIDSTEDHAVDLDADGFHLKAEEARQRRDGYDNSRRALFDSWGYVKEHAPPLAGASVETGGEG